MRPIIIFDLEFTTWEGAVQRNWTGENEYREIVQISAIKVDWPKGVVIDHFNLLVKPKLNPQLSDYFQKLTGITQEQVDRDGIEFYVAVQKFLDFCDRNKVLSYGADNMVLAENDALHRCHTKDLGGWNAPHYIDVNPLIRAADPVVWEKRVHSGYLWQHFGLERPDGAGAHDAAFDCLSVLATIKHLYDQGRITF